MAIKSSNKTKFSAEVSSRLHFLDQKYTIQTQITSAFAAFSDMFDIAWYVMRRWGAKNIQKDIAFRDIAKLASLSINELRDIENAYAVHQDITKSSIITGNIFSKEKFVKVVVDYLEYVNPLFFITKE